MDKLLKTNKDVDQFLFWIGTLQAEYFNQTECVLEDSRGYCCLGVACNILQTELQEDHYNEGGAYVKYKDEASVSYISGQYPYAQKDAPKWLKEIDDYCNTKFGKKLSTMNDDGKTHAYIADFLLEKFEQDLL